MNFICIISFVLIFCVKNVLSQWRPIDWPHGTTISFSSADSDIFAGSDSGLYRLKGSTWVKQSPGLPNLEYLIHSNGYFFCAGSIPGTFQSGIFRMRDSGSNWNFADTQYVSGLFESG